MKLNLKVKRKQRNKAQKRKIKINEFMQMNMDFEEINLSRELLMNPSNHLRRLQYISYICFFLSDYYYESIKRFVVKFQSNR